MKLYRILNLSLMNILFVNKQKLNTSNSYKLDLILRYILLKQLDRQVWRWRQQLYDNDQLIQAYTNFPS